MRCSTSLFVWHCVADALLTFSSGLVILIGSYSFLKCLRKRAKSAAKLGGKAREWRLKSKRKKLVQVHPLGEVEMTVVPTNDGMQRQSFDEGKQVTIGLTRDEAATKLQGMYRRMKARQRIRWMIANIFEKVVDQRSGAFYYYNKMTGVSSWEKPKLMKDSDDLEMTPRSKATADRLRKKASQRGKR